jgi:hypothetical protein
MMRAVRAGQACVQDKSLLAIAAMTMAVLGAAWWLAVHVCDPNTCYWTLAAALSAGGGVALALTRIGTVAVMERSALAQSIDAMPLADWNHVIPADNPYMQPAYLRALERAGTQMRYAIGYRDGRPIAAASFQVLELDRDTTLQPTWRLPVRLVFSSLFTHGRARALISGNALHSWTGSYAHASGLDAGEAGAVFAELTRRVRRDEGRQGPIDFTVLRDVELQGADMDAVEDAGYMPLRGVEPTMVVPLNPTWSSGGDYVAAMSRKYRARVRRARKKGADLVRCDLSLEELLVQRSTLEPLLDNVVDKAAFKLARCSLRDVVELKRELGDRFVVRTYGLDGAVVGFSAALVHHDRLEALLVGIDYEHNQDRSLYQNMLYDFVEQGIERRCATVHLGRTALEIKSTVGAEPVALPILVRHRNPLVNRAVAVALRFVDGVEWTPRNPFPS